MKHVFRSLIASMVITAGTLGSASASLVGDSVNCLANFAQSSPSLRCNASTAVVGSGAEFTLVDGVLGSLMSADITGSSVILKSLYPGAGGFRYLSGDSLLLASLNDFLNPSAKIVGFNFSNVSGITGLSLSDVSFTDHSFLLDLNQISFLNVNSTATINLVFQSATVPEPGSLALFGLGLAGLAAVRRRKQS